MFQRRFVYKIKTRIFLFNNFFSPRKSCRVWGKVGIYRRAGREQLAIWRMRIACWILKATNTLGEYVILIAFPRQLRLRERTSMLNLYLPCLSRALLSALCTSSTKIYKWEHNGKGCSQCDTTIFFPCAVCPCEMLACLFNCVVNW